MTKAEQARLVAAIWLAMHGLGGSERQSDD